MTSIMTSKRIRITADSVCDLPKEVVSDLNIKIIPTYVNIGDKSIPDDGVALIREEFYQQLPSMASQPTSAAPSPGDAEEFYRQSLQDADHLISIHIPTKLSGVYNTMRLGAQAVDGDRITLVDSLQLSMDDVNEILAAIERVRQNLKLYAIIDTMEYMKRSGRVNSLVAGVGTFLKIKPIVTVWDGDVTSHVRVRTWSRAEDKLRELAQAEAPLDRLAILHIANRDGAEKFLDLIRDIAPEKTIISEVTPA